MRGRKWKCTFPVPYNFSSSPMEKIYDGKMLIGLHIGLDVPAGSIPHTAPEESLGLLTLKYPQGTHLKGHKHLPKERVTQSLQECFVIRKGTVRISIFGMQNQLLTTLTLQAGEAFIALRGGHAFDFLEDGEIIELKNGPYSDDKEYFEK